MWSPMIVVAGSHAGAAPTLGYPVGLPRGSSFLTLSVLTLGVASHANATFFGIDLITDWQPGVEFTATRVTVDINHDGTIGRVQVGPVFTTDDTVTGIRIAEFDIPDGDHRVVVDLLRPDETVLATIDYSFILPPDGRGEPVRMTRVGGQEPAFRQNSCG